MKIENLFIIILSHFYLNNYYIISFFSIFLKLFLKELTIWTIMDIKE